MLIDCVYFYIAQIAVVINMSNLRYSVENNNGKTSVSTKKTKANMLITKIPSYEKELSIIYKIGSKYLRKICENNLGALTDHPVLGQMSLVPKACGFSLVCQKTWDTQRL